MIRNPRSADQRRRLDTNTASTLETLFVLIKVGIALVGWMTVFLMTFLGYLTLPAIVLFGFLVIYTIMDFVSRRARKLRER